MAQVFTDSVSVKLYEEEESESWLRDVPGAPGLKWSLSVVPVKKDDVVDHIGAYVRVVGGRATVSGTFHAVDHCEDGQQCTGDTKQFKFDFTDGEKHGIDYLFDGSDNLSVEVTVYATFITPLPADTLAPAIAHESVAPLTPSAVDSVTTSGQNVTKMPRVSTDSVTVSFSEEDEPSEEESELRDVPGAPWLKWSLCVVPVMSDDGVDYIGAYIQVFGGPVTVSGLFHANDTDFNDKDRDQKNDSECTTETFKYDFKNGGKEGIGNLHEGNNERAIRVTCYVTFTLPPAETPTQAMIYELFNLSIPDSVDAVTKNEENEIKTCRAFTDTVDVGFSREDNTQESELRDVPGAPWLKWSLLVVPVMSDSDVEYIGAYIRVIGGPVTVSGTFHADDFEHEYKDDPKRHIYYDFVDREGTLKPFKYDFTNGGIRGIKNLSDLNAELPICVTCYATFTLPPAKTLVPPLVHEFLDLSNPLFDAVIEVEQMNIEVHRGFLSMISPVFNAIFGPDSEETKTGIIKITDFTAETVKNALEFCYGYNVEPKTTTEITDMIRFYNKFNIKSPIKKLTAWLKEKSIVEFAELAYKK